MRPRCFFSPEYLLPSLLSRSKVLGLSPPRVSGVEEQLRAKATHGTGSRRPVKIETVLYVHTSYFGCNCCVSKRKRCSELYINTYQCNFPQRVKEAKQHLTCSCPLQPWVPKCSQMAQAFANPPAELENAFPSVCVRGPGLR